MGEDTSQTTMRIVLRWTEHLSAYKYTRIHIPGSPNSWAEVSSRWGGSSYHSSDYLRSSSTISVSDDFIWPTLKEYLSAKNRHSTLWTSPVVLASDGMYEDKHGALRVPYPSDDIRLRLCHVAQTDKVLIQHYNSQFVRFHCGFRSKISAGVTTFYFPPPFIPIPRWVEAKYRALTAPWFMVQNRMICFSLTILNGPLTPAISISLCFETTTWRTAGCLHVPIIRQKMKVE